MLCAPVDLTLVPFFLPFHLLPAYVGPGIAAGAVAVVFGALFSLFLALFTVIYYPIKRLYKKRKKNLPGAADA